jgi:hypothetical protein
MMYALKRLDGGVSIMRLFPMDDGTFPDPKDEVAKWAMDEQDAVVEVVPISESDIPNDRTFRSAWCLNGDSKIETDMSRAREIWKERMRTARRPKLDELDRLHSRAIGRGNRSEADAIEAQRQTLRDVTDDPAVEKAQTPEELNAAWPSILN